MKAEVEREMTHPVRRDVSEEWRAEKREQPTRRVHPRSGRADLGGHVGLNETGEDHGLCEKQVRMLFESGVEAEYSQYPR